MFGLFKPPRYHIKKRLPPEAIEPFQNAEAFAVSNLGDLTPLQREFALAFILSVWACNSVAYGLFKLSVDRFAYIQNRGLFEARKLDVNSEPKARAVLERMIDMGMIASVASPDFHGLAN